MTVKNLELEDLYIIEEKPLRVKVGSRYLYIGSLPLKQADKFEMKLAGLLIKWNAYLKTIDILNYSDLHSTGKVETFSFMWKRILKSNKQFLQDVCKLICNPYHFSVRYFKRHANYAVVTQCFLASQLINYDAVKKNIQFLVAKAGIIQQQPTFLSSSPKSTGGQRHVHLTPRY